MPFHVSEDLMDTDEEMTHEEYIPDTRLEVRERAALRFAKLKLQMTKDAFETYAASKIAALYRGRCARYIVSEILDARESLKYSVNKYFIQKKNVHLDKKALAFSLKSLTMSYSEWRHYNASIVQKAWRSKISKKERHVLITETSIRVMIL